MIGKEQLKHGLMVMAAWLIVVTLFVAAGAMGVASAGDRPYPTPLPCDNNPKGGYIELNPDGQQTAETYITFTTPFCSPNYVIVANVVSDINTKGERIAVKLYTPGVASVTMELDAPSDNVFSAHWLAIMPEPPAR